MRTSCFRTLRASLGQPLRLHPASYPCRTGGRGRSGGFALFLPLSLGLVAYSCIKGTATPIILTRSVLALRAALRCGLR
ncbi:hypothetical protein D3C77_271300 [compost metagenome]